MPRWSTDGLDKQNLQKLYIEQELPATKIGELTGHDPETVLKYLRLHGIPIRTHSESTKGKPKEALRAFFVTKEELYRLYAIDRLTTTEIGKMYGFSRDTVLIWLHKYGIPIDRGRVKGLNKATLEKFYLEKQWSTIKVAKMLGCDDESVRKALTKYGVPTRTKSEAGKVKEFTPEHMAKLVERAKEMNTGKVGSLNHHWKGGRRVNSYGYVLLRVDKKDVLEHRYLMEQHIGHELNPWEEINHINGIKTDNRIENLEVIYSEHKHKDWIRLHP